MPETDESRFVQGSRRGHRPRPGRPSRLARAGRAGAGVRGPGHDGQDLHLPVRDRGDAPAGHPAASPLARSRHGRAGGDGGRRVPGGRGLPGPASTGCRCGSSRRRPCSARSWSAWPSTSAAPRPPRPTPCYYFWVALAACYFLRPAVAAAHLALASAGYGIVLLARGDVAVPGSEVGGGDGDAVRRRHPDDGAAGPDGADADAARRGGPHRLPDRAREPPRARGAVRGRARALDPGWAAAVDRGARPGLVQGVQRSLRARRRRPRAGPARRGAEAGDADQRRRRAAGRRGVRRARAGDRRARGLSARRAAAGRGQGDVRPPAGEDDGELRRGQLPRARHHRRASSCIRPIAPCTRPRRQDGTARSSSGTPAPRREDAEEAAIERTSPQARLARLAGRGGGPSQGLAGQLPKGGPLRRAAGPRASTFPRRRSSGCGSPRCCATSGRSAWRSRSSNKPAPLSDEERRELERHPEIGARIVGAAQLGRVGEWILSHHERPDGSGYPRGLREHQIPLEGRILAVADAYAAMTADRPYRRPLLAEARQGRAPGAGREPVRPRRGRGLPVAERRARVRRRAGHAGAARGA